MYNTIDSKHSKVEDYDPGDFEIEDLQSPTNGNAKNKGSFWDVFCFGICLASTNLFIEWDVGLVNGYWSFFFATVFTTSVFVNLHLCVAEMVSILPFSGGMYGFTRVTVGPYAGFLVGCLESIANIVYSLIAMIPIGTCITYIFRSNPIYEPLYWFLAYVAVLGLECLGRQFYFKFIRTYAFVIIMLVIYYMILATENSNAEDYIPSLENHVFPHGIKDFLTILPTAGWFFLSLEIMPLVSDEVHRAKTVVPKAIVATLTVIVLWEFLVVICAASQYPGLVDDEIKGYLPLNSGFRNAFHMDDHMATLISLPILFISNAIYIFGYGKQMKALAQSKLLPSVFGWTLPNTKIPFMSLIIGSLFGLLLMVILVKGFHFSYYSNTINDLFNAALLGSYFTFLITFISFIIFRRKFSSLSRGFRNPFGIYGAIYGIISLLFLWVAVIGFSDDRYDALIYVVCFLAICSIYYFSYAKYVQVYSEEEQNVLFVVYLIKANERKNQRIIRRSVPSHQPVRRVSVINSQESVDGGSVAKNQVLSPPSSSRLFEFGSESRKIHPVHVVNARSFKDAEEVAKQPEESV